MRLRLAFISRRLIAPFSHEAVFANMSGPRICNGRPAQYTPAAENHAADPAQNHDVPAQRAATPIRQETLKANALRGKPFTREKLLDSSHIKRSSGKRGLNISSRHLSSEAILTARKFVLPCPRGALQRLFLTNRHIYQYQHAWWRQAPRDPRNAHQQQTSASRQAV